jgi:hypothetical protein
MRGKDEQQLDVFLGLPRFSRQIVKIVIIRVEWRQWQWRPPKLQVHTSSH